MDELIFSSAWLRLVKRPVVQPDGSKHDYHVLQTKCGVGVVPVDAAGFVYLVGQYRHAIGTYSVEIPQGGFESFDTDELPLEAAQRELKEETGIRADSWQHIKKVYNLTGYSNDYIDIFLATELHFGTQELDVEEDIRIISVPLVEIDRYVYKGFEIDGTLVQMTNSPSIAALYMVRECMDDSGFMIQDS